MGFSVGCRWLVGWLGGWLSFLEEWQLDFSMFFFEERKLGNESSQCGNCNMTEVQFLRTLGTLL